MLQMNLALSYCYESEKDLSRQDPRKGHLDTVIVTDIWTMAVHWTVTGE